MTFIAMNKPKGSLVNMSPIDIADAAGWPEDRDAKEFVDALHGTGLLDCGAQCVNLGASECSGDTYSYHGWSEVNAWACGAPERSEQARRAAKRRWHGNADGNAQQCPPDAERIAPHDSASKTETDPDSRPLPPPPSSSATEPLHGDDNGDDRPLWSERMFQYKADKVPRWVSETANKHGVHPGDPDFDVLMEAEWGMNWERWIELRDRHAKHFSHADRDPEAT